MDFNSPNDAPAKHEVGGLRIRSTRWRGAKNMTIAVLLTGLMLVAYVLSWMLLDVVEYHGFISEETCVLAYSAYFTPIDWCLEADLPGARQLLEIKWDVQESLVLTEDGGWQVPLFNRMKGDDMDAANP